MLKKMGLLLAMTVSIFAMNSASININDKDVEVSGRLDMGQFNYSLQPNTIFIGAKYLKGSSSHSNFGHNDNGYYELNFLMQKKVTNTALLLGLGVKLNYTKADIAGGSRSFTAIALGMEAKYKLPSNRYVPLFLNGNIYYAPQVLSLSDANSFFSYRVHVDAEVIQNGYVLLGYRSINTSYKANSKTYSKIYNNSFYVGFRFIF